MSRYLRAILSPLAGVYALALSVRHFLYDKGWLGSRRVSVPTICVGNLSVGGTGKTPHVEYLVRLLTEHHYHVAVLSRGYKRRTKGFVLADEQSTADLIGDEPMQIHTHFPRLVMAVCEDRVKGIDELMKRHPETDVVILDDAMQHRSIRCGLTILLTRRQQLYSEDHLLPWGRLRDLKNRARTADLVVVTGCRECVQQQERVQLRNRLHLESHQPLACSHIVYEPIPKGKVLLVTGIAHPEALIAHVKLECETVDTWVFADHHRFSRREIQRLVEMSPSYDGVLTTEKDMARFSQMDLPQTLQSALSAIRIRVVADPVLDECVLSYVRKYNCETGDV